MCRRIGNERVFRCIGDDAGSFRLPPSCFRRFISYSAPVVSFLPPWPPPAPIIRFQSDSLCHFARAVSARSFFFFFVSFTYFFSFFFLTPSSSACISFSVRSPSAFSRGRYRLARFIARHDGGAGRTSAPK